MIGRIFASEIWGAHFREDLFWGRGGAYYRNFTILQQQPVTCVSLTECQKDISQHL